MWRDLNKETIYKSVERMQEDIAMHLPGMVRAKVLPVFSQDKACGPMLRAVATLGCVPRNRYSTPLLSPASHLLPIHPTGWTYREANDWGSLQMSSWQVSLPHRGQSQKEWRYRPTEQMFSTALHIYIDRQAHIHTHLNFLNFILGLPRWH